MNNTFTAMGSLWTAVGNTNFMRTKALSLGTSIWRKRQMCPQMIPELLVAGRHNSRVGFVTINLKNILPDGQWSITKYCHTEAHA